MCWFFNKNISEKQILEKLNFILKFKNEEFDLFNTTSVYFLFYCSLGMFGQNVIEPSLDVIKHFIDYLHNKPSFYLPNNGLESMFHPLLVEKIYLWIKNNKIEQDELDKLDKLEQDELDKLDKLEQDELDKLDKLEQDELDKLDKLEQDELDKLEQDEKAEFESKKTDSNNSLSDSSNDFVKINSTDSIDSTEPNSLDKSNLINKVDEQISNNNEQIDNLDDLVNSDNSDNLDNFQIEEHLIIELLSIKIREFDEELCSTNPTYRLEKYWNINQKRIFDSLSFETYSIVFIFGILIGCKISLINMIIRIIYNLL